MMVTQSPMRTEVNEQKKLRFLYRKVAVRGHEISERKKKRDREVDYFNFVFLNLSILSKLGSLRLYCIPPGNLFLLKRVEEISLP